MVKGLALASLYVIKHVCKSEKDWTLSRSVELYTPILEQLHDLHKMRCPHGENNSYTPPTAKYSVPYTENSISLLATVYDSSATASSSSSSSFSMSLYDYFACVLERSLAIYFFFFFFPRQLFQSHTNVYFIFFF